MASVQIGQSCPSVLEIAGGRVFTVPSLSSMPPVSLDVCLRHAYIGARLYEQIIAQNEMPSPGLVLSRGPHFSWRNERRARCQLKTCDATPITSSFLAGWFFCESLFPLSPSCDCCPRIRIYDYHPAQVDTVHGHMQRLRVHSVPKLECTRRKRAFQPEPCIDICGEANC